MLIRNLLIRHEHAGRFVYEYVEKFIRYHYEEKTAVTRKNLLQKLLLEGKSGRQKAARKTKENVDGRYQGVDQQKIIRRMRERCTRLDFMESHDC